MNLRWKDRETGTDREQDDTEYIEYMFRFHDSNKMKENVKLQLKKYNCRRWSVDSVFIQAQTDVDCPKYKYVVPATT